MSSTVGSLKYADPNILITVVANLALRHVLSDIRRYSSHKSTVVPWQAFSMSRALMLTRQSNVSNGILLQDEVVIIGPDTVVEVIEHNSAHLELTTKIGLK